MMSASSVDMLEMQPIHIVLFGTCDTKLTELRSLQAQLLAHEHVQVTLVDVSAGDNPCQDSCITISSQDLRQLHPSPEIMYDDAFSGFSRGERITYMAACMMEFVRARRDTLHGAISMGGSGNTSLAAEVMRVALPLGFPKFILSTVASGDTGPIVGETDITLMYSVVDIAGLNHMLRSVIENAAGAIVGMARAYLKRQLLASQMQNEPATQRTRIGITMFGVTTAAVDQIQQYLSSYRVETFIFHATGHGGKAMERLISEGGLDAVIDLTTTEICDFICDGTMSAGPCRLDAAMSAGIPCILSLGATDIVNFGPLSTVPERYKQRQLYEHNSNITLMRTNSAECKKIGEFIVKKLKTARVMKNVQVWIPDKGVSAMSERGGPFEDTEADETLFFSIGVGLDDDDIRVIRRANAINDEAFAHGIAETMLRILGLSNSVRTP